MRVSKLVYGILKDRKVKKELSVVAGVTENTIYNWIKTDSDNLTKAAILDYFITKYGLTMDQVLEREDVAA